MHEPGRLLVLLPKPFLVERHEFRQRSELPVGQLVVYAGDTPGVLTRIPFRLENGRFAGVVVQAPGGSLPPGRYRFEVTVLLDPSIQPASVMRSLGDPSRLRGPGITRDRVGGAAFSHREEFQL